MVDKKKRKRVPKTSLIEDIEADSYVGLKVKKSRKQNKVKEIDYDSNDEAEDTLPEELEKKVYKQLKEHQEEVEKEDSPSNEEFSDEEDEELVEHEIREFGEDMQLDPEDEKTLSFFMNPSQETFNLRDVILQKIEEKERNIKMNNDSTSNLNPKVIKAYTLVGKLLKNYTSGRLPKAFNIIPSLKNWEEILLLTKPEEWSPQAYYAATKIFISNLNSTLVQRFNNIIIYPKIREEIQRYKKLRYHLYQALKKTLFKPDAFYKGILLPLCEEGNCTLKEAVIIGSIIKKVSIAQVHSSVALLKISTMPYSGANSLFISILLNKKYALPYEVIDALVEHFLRMKDEKRKLPVLWHQSLLIFAQRYKEEITKEQKEKLKYLLRHQNHHLITPEIRKELFSTKSRNEDDESMAIE